MKNIIFIITLLCFSQNIQSQCLSGDCKNGIGTYLFPSGARYEGNFINGEINGEGTCTFKDGSIYKGNWRNRFPEGLGTKTLANGQFWTGNWHMGIPLEIVENESLLTENESFSATETGESIQSGCILGNCENGNGTYAFPDGNKCEGNFKDGLVSGWGNWFYPNGDQYIGNFLEGQRDGKGTLYYANGSKLDGFWSQGEYEGLLDNAVKEGCIEGDCEYGYGTYVYNNAVATFTGDFENGMPNGDGIIVYANGEKYDGEWLDGVFDGEGILYNLDGNIIEGFWENGMYKGASEKYVDTTSYVELKTTPEKLPDFKPKNKVWAVIIGISVYNHMPVLKYSDDDAYRIYAFLKSPEGGALPDNQIQILVDEEATRQNIMDSMNNLFAKADTNDLIFLYFSGHGLNGCFLPIDYDGYDNKLMHADIQNILEKSPAKFKICIADACHSGSFLAAKTGNVQTTLQKYYQTLSDSKGGIALLLSSKSEETSLESNGLRQGVFTHFLMRGMKGEADANGDKIVTIKELYTFVETEVKHFTMKNQSPILNGEFDSNMPISVIR